MHAGEEVGEGGGRTSVHTCKCHVQAYRCTYIYVLYSLGYGPGADNLEYGAAMIEAYNTSLPQPCSKFTTSPQVCHKVVTVLLPIL